MEKLRKNISKYTLTVNNLDRAYNTFPVIFKNKRKVLSIYFTSIKLIII